MTAEWKDRSGRRGVKRLGVVGRPAVAVEDAALGNLRALVECDLDLALGDRAGRDVEDDRGPVRDWHARRDRVGRKPATGSSERGDENAAATRVHEMERDLAGAGGHLGPVADPAQMARVPQGHHGHALAACLFDADLDCVFAHHLAEAELAVDHGDRIVLEDDLERLVGDDLAARSQSM